MKEQLDASLKTITAKLLVPAISAVIGLGGGAYIFEPIVVNYIVQNILTNEQVISKIKEASIQKGGFRTELEGLTGVSSEDIPKYISTRLEAVDSLKTNRCIDIGLKQYDRMKYLAPDGELYRAIYSNEYKRYYYISDEGLSVWCY